MRMKAGSSVLLNTPESNKEKIQAHKTRMTYKQILWNTLLSRDGAQATLLCSGWVSALIPSLDRFTHLN